MSLGARICEMRKARGWTQATLATEANLSPSAIAMYETNRRTPDSSALQKLASAFGVSMDTLLDVSEVNEVTCAAAESGSETSISAPLFSLGTQAAPNEDGMQLTQLALTHEEAKFILFLRMNPSSREFIDSYIRADARQRDQLARTWRLIQAFQPGQTKSDDT